MLLKLHGPKEDEDYKKAQGLVMTTTPSAAAKELIDLICDQATPLESCCCTKTVSSLWRDMLPTQVKAHVANMKLKTAAERRDTLDAADQVFQAIKGPKIAAADVAAISTRGTTRGKGRGQQQQRGGSQQTTRGGGGAGRGTPKASPAAAGRGSRSGRQAPDPKDPSTWGDPHPDGPPPGACMQHYHYGKGAWICRRKKTCPWASLADPPQDE